jgi:hypothetical protein
MAIIKVDGSVSPEIVQAMLGIKNVVKVHSVAL